MYIHGPEDPIRKMECILNWQGYRRLHGKHKGLGAQYALNTCKHTPGSRLPFGPRIQASLQRA